MLAADTDTSTEYAGNGYWWLRFRVRAYQINGAKKVYGAWSKTKKITTKK